MKKHRWKAIGSSLVVGVLAVYGINVNLGDRDEISIQEEIRTISNSREIVIEFGKRYNLQDGYKIQIDVDQYGRKRVIFTPGGN